MDFWGSQGSWKVAAELMFCRRGQRLGVWRFQCRCFQNVLYSVQSQERLAVSNPEDEWDKKEELAPGFKPQPYSLSPVFEAKLQDWHWEVDLARGFFLQLCAERTYRIFRMPGFMLSSEKHCHSSLNCEGQSQGAFLCSAWSSEQQELLITQAARPVISNFMGLERLHMN